MNKHSNLLQRSKIICTSNHIMIHKYLFEESYALKCKRRFECDIADSIADSIYSLFCTYDDFNSQLLLYIIFIYFILKVHILIKVT